jgi:hypothetical protein
MDGWVGKTAVADRLGKASDAMAGLRSQKTAAAGGLRSWQRQD